MSSTDSTRAEQARADSERVDQLIGQVLANRYQIEVRLGEGAMGSVYRARHVKVGRPFAIKLLHPRLLEDDKTLQRFEREAELAGRLHHPNVIGVVDVGETPDGLRYMVMDFAEGHDLAALLIEAPMPPERIHHLTRQMLEGLYHAHEAGLIHRDFKPENVIVERDTHGAEVPRIVDFGIAILREGGAAPDGTGRLTTNGLVLGTPHYMAPEQAVDDPIDHRIDLFALGIMIYEMLCGKLPFDGSGAEVARANLLLDPPPIAERVPYLEVDPLLEAFSRRLMAKRRDHRPATAKAARELLDLIANDRAAAAVAARRAARLFAHAAHHPGGATAPCRGRLPGHVPAAVSRGRAPQAGAGHAAAGRGARGDPAARRADPADGTATVRAAGGRARAAEQAPPHRADRGDDRRRRGARHRHRDRREQLGPRGRAAGHAGSSGRDDRTAGSSRGPAAASAGRAGRATPTPTPTPTAQPTLQPTIEPPAAVTHAPHKPLAKAKPPPATTAPRLEPAHVRPTVEVPHPISPAVYDANAFRSQWVRVGAELKTWVQAHGVGGVSDLQGLYNQISYVSAVSTPASREAAKATLDDIHAKLAARKP